MSRYACIIVLKLLRLLTNTYVNILSIQVTFLISTDTINLITLKTFEQVLAIIMHFYDSNLRLITDMSYRHIHNIYNFHILCRF